MKKWIVPELDKNMVRKLQSDFELPVFTSMLLTLRGITSREDIIRFFSDEPELDDPMNITDMDKAASRIRQAVRSSEKICVYGDYDCDGVTSTALLYTYLQSVFANVIYYIPDRNSEGYGLNKKAIDKLAEKNVSLIVTVDNGISAIDEAEYAASLGIDLVITDHHKPLDILPKAVAVVDPHRQDETNSFRDYSGAGLALKLACAIESSSFMMLENYSDLAALGTVADIVPLTGENRLIVKSGLSFLNNTERVGLYSLFESADINNVTAGTIGFRIAPRINAAGRLASPYGALELLLTENEDFAMGKAQSLDELNSRRQQIENEIFEDVCRRFSEQPSLLLERVIIVAGEGWNAGVIGIVCSRITEKYGKPSILISVQDDICKASGRSISGFSLVDAVFYCSRYLEKYGGHPMAVGFSIKKENINDFCKAMYACADKEEHMPAQTLKLECNLNPDIINPDVVRQLEAFEPFGCGNPKPVFGLKNMKLDKIGTVGAGKHLRISVSRDRSRFTMMKFFSTVQDFPFAEGDVVDIAVSLELNLYQGRENTTFIIKDIKPAAYDTEKDIIALQDYESYKMGKILPKGDVYPERADFERVYRFIRSHRQPVYRIDGICSALEGLGAFRLLMILDIFSEIDILRYERDCDLLRIELVDVKVKSSLDVSYTYKKLREDINNARKN